MKTPLLTMRRTLFVLAVLILTPFWLPLVLRIFGFYVDEPGWYVAKIAVEKGKPISVCQKIITTPWNFLTPPAASQRALCVYDFARLTQDPSACELLMPSEYGLSCIGEIWGKLIDESNCHWYKDSAVRCFEGKTLTPHVYNCQEQDLASLSDECKHRIAFKEKKEDMCDKIAHPVLSSVCKVRIGVWKKYLELRSTLYFKDNIE